MPTTAVATKKDSAEFINDYGELCELRVIPQSRRTKFEVVWTCGDSFFFPASELKALVEFFGNGKKKNMERVSYMLHRLYNPGDDLKDARQFSLVRVYKDQKSDVMLDVTEYGRAVNWASFVNAWKSLNNN